MLFFVVAPFFAVAAMANPVAVADRATPDCSTIFSGYLAANASGQLHQSLFNTIV